MKIHTLHAFTDNFIFVVESNRSAMVVDPGDAGPVIEFLTKSNLRLEIILLTHCHNDHIGGVKNLLTALNPLQNFRPQIFGPARLVEYDILPDQALSESTAFEFQGSQWKTLHLPGHTFDHLAYFNAQEKVLFCGDVLFSLGCGRIFEGSFEEAFNSLQKIRSLPIDTYIYCAHEYTLANCNFHISENLLPQTEYLNLRTKFAEEYAHHRDTIPTSLQFELKYNSFLKAQSLEEFTQLRLKRNQFKNLPA